MNLEGVYNLIDTNKLRYNDVRDTIQEMIFVLSRTVLRDLEDLKLISYLRNKYNKKISLVNSDEDLWNVLFEFSKECIDKNRAFWRKDKGNLIENINEYIKKYYKVSITEYINLLRIEESKKYLLDRSMSVSDICKKVGFNNSSYFSQIFKKFNSITPNEYRKNMLDNKY